MTAYEGASFAKSTWGTVTAADFRAWGSACQTVLNNSGLTQVSSSTNWVNTTPSGTASTYNAGDVAVYKFNDGITPEVYIKFEWGRGATTGANQLQMRVTVSGDSAFATSATHYVSSGGTTAETASVWSACFIDSGFVLFSDEPVSNASTNQNTIVVVERSRSADNTPTDEAILFCMNGSGVNSTTATANSAWAVSKLVPEWRSSTLSYSWLMQTPLAQSALTTNADAVCSYLWGAEEHLYQTRTILQARSTTVGVLAEIAVNDGVGNKAYRSLRSTGTALAGSSQRLLYRWA